MAFLFFIVKTVSIFLSVIEFAIFFRVLASWIFLGEESSFTLFLYTFTEPFLLPARLITEKIEFFRSMPFDFSYFITIILISVIQALLPDFPM